MRSLSSTLLISLLLVLSIVACKKKEESQNQQAASNEAAATPPAAQPATPPATQPATPAPTQPPTTTPPPVKSPTLTQPALHPVFRPGAFTLSDRNSIAGYWRGTTSLSKVPVIFHFNSDGWGSVDVAAFKVHNPASIATENGNVKISMPSTQESFAGTLKDGKMTGVWTKASGHTEDLVLTKD